VKPIRPALILATAALAAVPVPALAAGAPSSQITPTAPSGLTTPTTATTPGVTTTTSGNLPNTGLNLLPETVAGLALVGAGIGLRARRSRA